MSIQAAEATAWQFRIFLKPLILLVVLNTCRTGFGQVFYGVQYESVPDVVIHIGPGGRVYPYVDELFRPAISIELRVLASEALRDEMEFSDDQWNDFQKLLKEVEDRLVAKGASSGGKRSDSTDGAAEKATSPDDAKASTDSHESEATKEIVRVGITPDWQDSLKKRIDDILLPHQQLRVSELLVRFTIRSQGFYKFFVKNRERLDLPYSFLDRLTQKENTRLAEELTKKSVEAKSAAIRQLLDTFPKNRQQRIRKEFENVFRLNAEEVDYGVLVWQLGQVEERDSFWSRRTRVKYQEIVEGVNTFRVSEQGTFEPRYVLGQQPDKKISSIVPQLLLLAIMDSETQEALVLTNQQILQIDILNVETMSKNDALDARYATEFDNLKQEAAGSQAVLFEEIRADREREKIALWNPVVDEIEAILLPHQRDELEKRIKRQKLFSMGLVATLLDSEIGKDLGITDDERKRLRETARTVRKQLMEKSIEIEGWLYDEVISMMEEQQQELFRPMIGAPLTTGSANIDMLVRHFLMNYQ